MLIQYSDDDLVRNAYQQHVVIYSTHTITSTALFLSINFNYCRPFDDFGRHISKV